MKAEQIVFSSQTTSDLTKKKKVFSEAEDGVPSAYSQGPTAAPGAATLAGVGCEGLEKSLPTPPALRCSVVTFYFATAKSGSFSNHGARGAVSACSLSVEPSAGGPARGHTYMTKAAPCSNRAALSRTAGRCSVGAGLRMSSPG